MRPIPYGSDARCVGVHGSERSRTGRNETETETERGLWISAHVGAERLPTYVQVAACDCPNARRIPKSRPTCRQTAVAGYSRGAAHQRQSTTGSLLLVEVPG